MKCFIVPSFALVLASCATSSGPGPVVPETPVERKMIGLLEKFDRWDFDGNGQLTASELVESEKISGHTAQEILDFYDTDRSGGISLREAQAGFARVEEAERRAKR